MKMTQGKIHITHDTMLIYEFFTTYTKRKKRNFSPNLKLNSTIY